MVVVSYYLYNTRIYLPLVSMMLFKNKNVLYLKRISWLQVRCEPTKKSNVQKVSVNA